MIRVLHYCFGAKFLDGYSLVIHLSSEKSPSLRGNLSINGQFSSICHFPLPAVNFPEGTLILSLSFSLSLTPAPANGRDPGGGSAAEVGSGHRGGKLRFWCLALRCIARSRYGLRAGESPAEEHRHVVETGMH